MIVKTLDGKPYKWKYNNNDRCVSKLQKTAANIILNEFPNIRVYYEVAIKISKTKPSLYIDIYIPCFNLAIEVHGEQHTTINNHFHDNVLDFFKQQANDSLKKSWCEVNNIPLIYLYQNEKMDVWRNRILDAIRSCTG